MDIIALLMLIEAGESNTLPRQYRLFYSPRPNSGSAWSIPRTVTDRTGTERDMFEILGVGIFFDAAGNSLLVSGAQILARPETNQWQILFSLSRGLAIYDKSAADLIILKAHNYFKLPQIDLNDAVVYGGSRILFYGSPLVFRR